MAKIHLEIVTPESSALKEDVDEVTLPGLLGEFGVLQGHTTFLSQLGSGRLSFIQNGETKVMEISGGFTEVRADQVTVLADQLIR